MAVATASRLTPPEITNESTRRRGRRVLILLAAIFLLGMGDLYATLTHVNSIGMVELNPVANYLIMSESNAGLILYKFGTVGIAIGLLLRTRFHRTAEAACWGLLLVMTMLTFHWFNYNEVVARELDGANYNDVTYVVDAMNRQRDY